MFKSDLFSHSEQSTIKSYGIGAPVTGKYSNLQEKFLSQVYCFSSSASSLLLCFGTESVLYMYTVCLQITA